MSETAKRPAPIHLSEEQLLSRLPGQIGKVKLDYTYYPGEDLYSDGAIEDELLSIVKESARIEYPEIIEKKNSWPILYHCLPCGEISLTGCLLEKTIRCWKSDLAAARLQKSFQKRRDR